MDIFCEPCAKKPGWPWDPTKVIMHSCQRCFIHRPCNDYAWRKPQSAKVEAAPNPKSLVGHNVNTHAECNLPPAKGHTPPAQPVYEVAAPEVASPVVTHPVSVPAKDNGKTEGDLAMEVISKTSADKTPRGVRIETMKGGGRNAVPSPAPTKAPSPAIELAEDTPAK